MTIIKIVPHTNGAHANQTTMTPLPEIPEGWAVVPEGMEIPDTFPFVGIEVEGQVVSGQQIQVDDSKAFCFCPQCGRKIPVSTELPQQSIAPQPGTVSQPEALGQALAFSPEIDRKLEEAAFYYQLSQVKDLKVR